MKHNTKHSILTIVLLLAPVIVWAEEVSADKARSIAAKFLDKRRDVELCAKGSVRSGAQLSMAAVSEGYYAFGIGEDDGFVLVAKDDNCGVEVLGYADEGRFDLETFPPALLSLLQSYDLAVKIARPRENISARTSIAPLLTSKWGQKAPYNNMCPLKANTSGVQQRCLTGCVATSLAQVMRYHKWPVKGTDTYNGYDFSQSAYDWANMKDAYNYYYDENGQYTTVSTTTVQNNAVALLMRDCGTAAKMNYGLEASGATQTNIMKPLYTNLGYDRDIRYIDRQYYTADEWCDVIYHELAEGRPVIYEGSYFDKTENARAAHSFVCDGYDDGMLHFNWGWNGSANGYFVVGAMPYYYEQNCALIGITPRGSIQRYVPTLWATSFSIELTSGGEAMSMSIRYLKNSGNRTETGMVGVKVEDNNGNITYIPSSTTLNINAGEEFSYSKVVKATFSVSQMPASEGIYRVTPAYISPEGDWYDINWQRRALDETVNLEYPFIDCYKLTRSHDSVELSDSRTSSTLKATLNVPETWYAGYDITLYGFVTATQCDYNGYLTAAISSTGRAIPDFDHKIMVKLPVNGSMEYRLTLSGVPAGTYRVAVFDSNNMPASDIRTITITGDKPDVEFMVSKPVIDETMAVSSTTVTADVYSYKSMSGYFEAPILYENNESIAKSGQSLGEKTLTAGGTTSLKYSLRSKSLESGTIYRTAIYFKRYSVSTPERVTDYTYFRTAGQKTIPFTLTAAGWSTLMLPFGAEVPQGLTFYEVSSNDNRNLILNEVSEIEANVPYLVNGEEGSYTFSGTPEGNVVPEYRKGLLTGAMYSHEITGNEAYVLQKLNGILGFYQIGADRNFNLPMYRCYLHVNTPVTSFLPLENTTTEITDADTNDDKDVVYTMSGVRIDKSQALRRGMYIVNGRKVVK